MFTVVEWTSDPLVPVIVMTNFPVGPDALVWTVSVEVEVVGFGENEYVEPG